MNILVSGVAGDVGFGVGRILRDCKLSGSLHGIDIHGEHAGAILFDRCSIAPPASSSEYMHWLVEYVALNEIAMFIPTSEAEIGRIKAEKVRKIGVAKILVSNDATVLTSLDKFECLSFLFKRGINVPANGVVGFSEPERYPVIVKPRYGQGSKGVIRVDDEHEYNLQAKGGVWQEYLSPDDQEYTCPVYRSAAAGMRILLLKRKLQGGTTASGEVVEADEISEYVRSIAVALDLDGVMNVQLRLTPAGPLLFEINPRLSSTLVFRDKLGFSDLRWWLADALDMIVPPYAPPRMGTRFYRGAQEYILASEKTVQGES